MSDFKIDVGFTADELKNMTSSSGFQPSTSSDNQGGVLANVLKASGLMTVLTGMKVVLDTIGFVLAGINAILGYLLSQVVLFLVPFFKDPTRALLGLSIDIVNGFITGIEYLGNLLVSGLNQVPGIDLQTSELPRFQKEIILEAYDKLREVGETVFIAGDAGDQGADMIKEASRNYAQSWSDAFMITDDFEKVKEESQKAGLSLQETSQIMLETGESIEKATEAAGAVVKTNISNAFGAVDDAMNYLEKKAREITGQRFSSSSNTSKSSSSEITRNVFNSAYGFIRDISPDIRKRGVEDSY